MLTDNQYLLLAINAAVLAGQEVERIYNEGFEVEYKADNSPVTKADLESDRIIYETLQQSGLQILSEEAEKIPYEVRRNLTRYWCVDPIDGTKGFVRKTGSFCVCIAQIKAQRAHLGVIYLPLTKELFYGVKGMGAFKTQISNPIKNLAELKAVTLPSQKQPENYTVYASANHLNQRTKEYIDKLKLEHPKLEMVRVGSAIKYCRLAEGMAHLYPRCGQLNDWDLAAGHALVEAAGGKVEKLDGGEVLYDGDKLYRENFICKL